MNAKTSVSDGRDETVNERADRNWEELMQELRVMQTGTQVIAGFLLAMAFQSRFTDLDGAQISLYLALVFLAALATLLSLTPVVMHRRVFGERRKPALVRFAAAVVSVNLVVVGLLALGVMTLIVDFVWSRTAALVALCAGGVIVAGLWGLLPRFIRHASSPSGARKV